MSCRPSSSAAPRRPVSLAEYAQGLEAGSTCFCCDGDMRSAMVTGTAGMSGGGDLTAVCPLCGGGIGALQVGADAGPSGHEARSHLGTAA
jgi:hypothetical protein